MTCATRFDARSYEKSVTGPLRSDRKKIRSPTHIGLKSLAVVRGTFSIFDEASDAIQMTAASPPR